MLPTVLSLAYAVAKPAFPTTKGHATLARPAAACQLHHAATAGTLASTTRDPWAVLNLTATASPDSVRRAFLDRAVELHPDVNPGCPELALEELLLARRARDVMLYDRGRERLLAAAPAIDGSTNDYLSSDDLSSDDLLSDGLLSDEAPAGEVEDMPPAARAAWPLMVLRQTAKWARGRWIMAGTSTFEAWRDGLSAALRILSSTMSSPWAFIAGVLLSRAMKHAASLYL